MKSFSFLLIIYLFSFYKISSSNELNCNELGFKETLLCSSCKDLEKFISDKGNI